MSLPNDLIEKIEHLPGHQQAVVRAFVDELARAGEKSRSKSAGWLGCLEHLHATVTEKDIDSARREMWADFPRDVPL